MRTWRHADGKVRVDHMDARPDDYFGGPICNWCKQPSDKPAENSRGEPCPCQCHAGAAS